ncbi:uncharacterized protein Z518_04875 [Rhinocladiella mackenziei CBS 650.93]|uniref:Uncharacterized protein n=1 Tax=Rhinocladiella mackenziei CBS 650.93 TaxID=1442369 RepID=A0A0D2IMB8_9EURO|nr:uncharacterized protein Z518_04875 [Rhinocladiella mackenziei CBS 650.93]KIX06899.1 hypothetical protein Z518_04875 [Rhinocladiella mackenziei CBS 650.93]
MQSIYHSVAKTRLVPIAAIRRYTASPIAFQPTAIHRAESAADLKKHPESGFTQEKLPDRKHSHHWSEENATISEADIKADRDAMAEELEKEKKEDKGAQ